MRVVLIAIMAIIVITSVARPAPALANDPALCLKTCIDKYGADKKQSCAVDCGYARGLANPQQKPVDCGTQYKRCLGDCTGGDQNCRKQCRQQRTSCY